MNKQFVANFIELKDEYFNRKSWKGTIITPLFLTIIVMISIQDFLFESFSSTTIGLFVISISMVWIGIFNSITSICSIRPKIKIQHNSGMSIGSFLWANVAFQFLQCIIQAMIVCVLVINIGMYVCDNFPEQGMIVSLYFEYFIIILCTIFAGDLLGILISSFSKNTVKAMTIMPLFLVIEMVFSNVLFKLPTFANNLLGKLTSITICKWSTSLLGIVSNLESMNDYFSSEAPSLVYTYSYDNLIYCLIIIFVHILMYLIISLLRLYFIKNERI